jgi:hypothetical protein
MLCPPEKSGGLFYWAVVAKNRKVPQGYSPARPIHAKSRRDRAPENAGSLTPIGMTFINGYRVIAESSIWSHLAQHSCG